EVPTLYSYINSLSFRVFGINVFAARATGLAFATLTIAAMYFFCRYVFGVPLGLLATALFAASRYHITMSRWGASEIAPSFYMLMSFGLLLRAIQVREGMTPPVKQGTGFWKSPDQLCTLGASLLSVALMSFLLSRVTLGFREPQILVRLSEYHARIQAWQGFKVIALLCPLMALGLFLRALLTCKYRADRLTPGDFLRWPGWLFIASGLFLGLCIYTYLASRLVAVVVCAYMIALAVLRFRLFRRHFWGLFLLGMVFCMVFSPLAYHYGSHWLVFTHRWHDINIFKFCREAGNMRPFWVSLQRHLLMFNWMSNEVIRHGMPGKPLLNGISGVLFALGAAFALRRVRHPFYCFVHLWFWLTLMGGILSFRGAHESPCSYPVLTCAPAIYVFIIIAALEFWDGLVVFFSGVRFRLFKGVFWGVLLLLSTLASILDLYVYFGIQAKDPRMWAHYNPVEHEAAVRVKKYTEDHHVFLNPHYFTFSTVELLNYPYRNVEKFLGVEALPFVMPEDKPVAMIMSYEDAWLEPMLRKFYPNVRMVPYEDPVTKGIGFKEFFVPKQDIENSRGLIATYTLDSDQGVSKRRRETSLDVTISAATLDLIQDREGTGLSVLWEGLIQIPVLGEYWFQLQMEPALDHADVEIEVSGSKVVEQGRARPVT
ncbi:MAG TPA: glycosyltransferase family 39 protein, partial [bacterium]|nr:glycosyltransferase family 39 protein [bacterium]